MFERPSAGVRRESLIGLIAIALPIYLLISTPTFHSGMNGSSISAHFYSDKRDMFVFALILMGIFQLRYKGMTHLDRVVSVVGATSAVCVGFFPTPPASPTAQDTMIGIVHFAAATLLFGIQAFHCLVFGRRARQKSRLRSTTYFFFSVTIITSIVAIVLVNLLGITDAPWNPVFWFEAAALFAFGCSWLISIIHRRVNPLFVG